MKTVERDVLRVFETFSGYGSQSLALKMARVPHKVVGISEIEPNAIKAYGLMHGEDIPNYGDITKIDPRTLPDFDFLTYSFPCTSLTSLGKRMGMVEGSGTESSLLWEVYKFFEVKRPKFAMMENVKGLLAAKNRGEFERWISLLNDLGYTSSFKVLNASNFGLPQNRERVIMISVLNADTPFDIPTSYNNKKGRKVIRDVMDFDVHPKYYMKEEYEKIYKIDRNDNKGRDKIRKIGTISPTYGRRNAGLIFDADGISPTVIKSFGTGGNNTPHIYLGRKNGKDVIRRLTPIECLRLQGVKDKYIFKLIKSDEFSDAALYQLAGNSIPVNMLFKVFKELFK